MATMLHHTPSKRLHEEDISEPVHPDSIKRPRVLHELISPRSPLSDFPTTITTATAIEVFPDAIELPEEDIHTQRRKHSLDTISEKDDSEDELLEDASGQSPRRHSRQRRRISEDLVAADDDNDDEDLHRAHRIMLPTDYIRRIPEVVLEPHKTSHHLPSSNAGITTSLTTTNTNLQQQQQPSRGPVIEEIPYNPLALIPYSPPPLIFFPGLASNSQNTQQRRDTMEEGGGDGNGDAMEVLPILTPLDAGYMLGPMNTQCDNDEEDGDAMEE